MKKLISVGVATLLVVGLLTSCTNREMGTAGGAVVGGVAGNLVTGGSAVGTAVGAVGGAVVGNQLAR